MKRYMLLASLFATSLVCHGAEIPQDLANMAKRIKIGTINNDTIRDDGGKRIEVFKFSTYQDERDKGHNFRMRVTVQMTDRADNTCYAQINREQGPVHNEYTGEDVWEFHIPHGEMDRPKVTAYAIQYGVLRDGAFIPLIERIEKADTVEEITAKSACRVDFSKTLHYYWYRNLDEERVSSTPN